MKSLILFGNVFWVVIFTSIGALSETARNDAALTVSAGVLLNIVGLVTGAALTKKDL